MRKIFTLVIAAGLLSSAPVFADEFSPKDSEDQLATESDTLMPEEIRSSEYDEADNAVIERVVRRCRVGYHLQAYRVRIGRRIIIRYRCVRNVMPPRPTPRPSPPKY